MKIRGFKLEVADPDAFYQAWREHRNGNKTVEGLGFYLSAQAEFGASPIRDKKSMDRFIADMLSIGIVYNVFAIT